MRRVEVRADGRHCFYWLRFLVDGEQVRRVRFGGLHGEQVFNDNDVRAVAVGKALRLMAHDCWRRRTRILAYRYWGSPPGMDVECLKVHRLSRGELLCLPVPPICVLLHDVLRSAVPPGVVADYLSDVWGLD